MGAEKVGKIEQILHGHTKAVQAVTFSNDGGWLASGGDDQTILVWRLNDPDFPAMGAEEFGENSPKARPTPPSFVQPTWSGDGSCL